MKWRFHALMRSVVCLAMFGASAMAVHAAEWPDKPIKLVLPSSAGTPIDILARVVGEQMQKQLGQSVVVENKPGADGSIAATGVAGAKPDGYTLLLGNAGIFTIIPSYDTHLSYDPIKQFSAVARVVTAPLVIDVRPGLEAKTLQEFVALTQAKPNTYTYASSTGRSGIAYLFGEQIKSLGGADLTWVGYSQDSGALNDLLAGRIDMYIDAVGTSLPHYKTGKLNILAVLGDTRSALLPDVPTVKESGFKDVGGDAWVAIFAPAGTAQDRIAKVNQALKVALADEAVRERLIFNGFNPAYSTPDELEGIVRADTARWKDLISRLKLERK